MKQLIANILFSVGDLISKVPVAFYIPGAYYFYSWVMLKSYDLDVNHTIWEEVKDDR